MKCRYMNAKTWSTKYFMAKCSLQFNAFCRQRKIQLLFIKRNVKSFCTQNFKQNCFHAWSIFHFMHIIVNVFFILRLTKNIFCEQNVTKSMNTQSLNEICILCRKRLNNALSTKCFYYYFMIQHVTKCIPLIVNCAVWN